MINNNVLILYKLLFGIQLTEIKVERKITGDDDYVVMSNLCIQMNFPNPVRKLNPDFDDLREVQNFPIQIFRLNKILCDNGYNNYDDYCNSAYNRIARLSLSKSIFSGELRITIEDDYYKIHDEYYDDAILELEIYKFIYADDINEYDISVNKTEISIQFENARYKFDYKFNEDEDNNYSVIIRKKGLIPSKYYNEYSGFRPIKNKYYQNCCEWIGSDKKLSTIVG